MSEDFKTFRDQFLSVFQSAAAEMAGSISDDEPVPESADAVPAGAAFMQAATTVAALRAANLTDAHPSDEPLAEALTPIETARVCSSLGLQYLEARVKGDTSTAERLKGELLAGTCDPRWASTLEEYIKYFGPSGTRRQIPYVRASKVGNKVIEINAGARVALIGDWGTGTQPARTVLQQAQQQGVDVLIHLGDIYYSGTESECAGNFERVINDTLRADGYIPVFTLAGNHDMYSGGEGYYGLIRRLNKPKQRQPASFFCLRTEDNSWQLLAMDTGLHDYSPLAVTDVLTFIEQDEEEWHRQRIEEFPGKTILLSHHQLFSAFSQIGKPAADGKLLPYNPRLRATFDRLQATGKSISAWFWGHEHNLCIYEPFVNLQRGRCVGHGAIPVFSADNPYQKLHTIIDPPGLVEGTKVSALGNVFAHGFALLALGKGTGIAVTEYFEDRNGSVHALYREEIQ